MTNRIALDLGTFERRVVALEAKMAELDAKRKRSEFFVALLISAAIDSPTVAAALEKIAGVDQFKVIQARAMQYCEEIKIEMST